MRGPRIAQVERNGAKAGQGAALSRSVDCGAIVGETEKQSGNNGRTAHLKPHQWKPGQSGNPAGRPKSPSLRERLVTVLERQAKDVPYAAKLLEDLSLDDGATVGDVVASALCVAAISGNAALMKDIFDRIDGKPHESVKHDLKGNITVRFKDAEESDATDPT